MKELHVENPDIEKRIQRDVAVAERLWGIGIRTHIHYLSSPYAVKKKEIMKNIGSLQTRKLFRRGQEVSADTNDIHVYYISQSYLKGGKGSGVIGLYYGGIPKIGRGPSYKILSSKKKYNAIFIGNQPEGQYILAHEIGHAFFYNHPLLEGYDPETLGRNQPPQIHHPHQNNLMFSSVPTDSYQPPRIVTRTQRRMALQSGIVKVISKKR
ncbi:hypothetical protein ACFOU2_20665 [Bacillus songklensis]|uniref:IrrE N-terminal-like domain-containing protein n=2 Tax=Bacillus songklensis TaxID=1069116 RepID=A0ABV8B8T2_9BACI